MDVELTSQHTCTGPRLLFARSTRQALVHLRIHHSHQRVLFARLFTDIAVYIAFSSRPETLTVLQ